MGHPNSYHGTVAETRFVRSISRRGRLSRLQMLQAYRAAAEKRADWGAIDAGEVLHVVDREIAAEIKKTSRKAA